MKNVTISKMSQKNEEKFLWAIIDMYGHTMMQVWSEKEPTDFVKKFIIS